MGRTEMEPGIAKGWGGRLGVGESGPYGEQGTDGAGRNLFSAKARQAAGLRPQRYRLRFTGQFPGEAPKCSLHSSNELTFKILDEQFFRRINPGNTPSAKRYCGKRILHH